MSARADVDDPRFDATPGVDRHHPVLLQLLGDTDCVMGLCEHQCPPHCPTVPVKACRTCSVDDLPADADLQSLTGAAMRWPCPVARRGSAR